MPDNDDDDNDEDEDEEEDEGTFPGEGEDARAFPLFVRPVKLARMRGPKPGYDNSAAFDNEDEDEDEVEAEEVEEDGPRCAGEAAAVDDECIETGDGKAAMGNCVRQWTGRACLIRGMGRTMSRISGADTSASTRARGGSSVEWRGGGTRGTNREGETVEEKEEGEDTVFGEVATTGREK